MSLNLILPEIKILHYVYIICRKDHVEQNKQIFKIGSTHNMFSRLSSLKKYPKGSILFYLCRVKDSVFVETLITEVFLSYFRLENNKRYFNGDIATMIKYADKVINQTDQRIDFDMSEIIREYEDHLRFNVDTLDIANYEVENHKVKNHYLLKIKKKMQLLQEEKNKLEQENKKLKQTIKRMKTFRVIK